MIRTTMTFAAARQAVTPESRLQKVALNPQPLPPKQVFEHAARGLYARMANPAASRGIIVVGGKPATANPMADRGIIVVGGSTAIPNPAANRGIIIVGGK